MNLTDLADELRMRSGDAAPDRTLTSPQLSTSSRLAALRGRIRRRRHRQAAAVAGLAAAAVVAVVLVPAPAGRWSDLVPRPASTARPDVTTTPSEVTGTQAPVTQPPFTADPAGFEPDRSGDPLISSTMSSPGDAEATITFTPVDTNLGLSRYCRDPEAMGSVDDPMTTTAVTTINGHRLGRTECVADSYPDPAHAFSEDPVANRAAWAERGVRPGVPSVIRIQARSGTAALAATLELGLGLYGLNDNRVYSDGVSIKKRLTQPDGVYRLVDYRTAASSPARRSLSLALPDRSGPGLVLAGNPDDDRSGRPAQVKLSVEGAGAAGTSSTELLQVDLPEDALATPTGRLQLAKGRTGTMLIAYYVKVD